MSMNKEEIKALFPDDIEAITISKNDYDRLFGELTYKNIELQQRIERAIEYIRKNDTLYEFKIDMSPEAIPNSVVVDDYKCRKELIEILGGKE